MNSSHDLYWNQSNPLNPTEPVSETQGAPTPEEIGITFLFFVAGFNSFSCLVGIFGNALTITAILRNDCLHSIADMFVLSLASSDMIVVAIYQPTNAYYFGNLRAVKNNTNFLIFRSFVGFLSLIASVTNLFGITMERFFSIKFALKYKVYVTFTRAKYVIISTWLMSVLAGLVYAKKGIASPIIPQTYFLLLLLGTVIIYIYILTVARRQEKAIVVPNGVNQARSAYERKAARTIAIVLGFALTSWLPFLLLPIFISRDTHPVKFYQLFYFLLTISTCNSTINPFVYGFRSERYRNAFAKLLGFRGCRP